jgi:hypothetical protein
LSICHPSFMCVYCNTVLTKYLIKQIFLLSDREAGGIGNAVTSYSELWRF